MTAARTLDIEPLAPRQPPPVIALGLEMERRGLQPPPAIAGLVQEARRRGIVGQAPGSPEPFALSPDQQALRAGERYQAIVDAPAPTDADRQAYVSQRYQQRLADLMGTWRRTPRFQDEHGPGVVGEFVQRFTRPDLAATGGLNYEQREQFYQTLDPATEDKARQAFADEFDALHSPAARFEQERQQMAQALGEQARLRDPEASDQEVLRYQQQELARMGYTPPAAGQLPVVRDQQGLERSLRAIRDASGPEVDQPIGDLGLRDFLAPAVGLGKAALRTPIAGDALAGALRGIAESVETVIGEVGVGRVAWALDKTFGTDLGLTQIQQTMRAYYSDRVQHGPLGEPRAPGKMGDAKRFAGVLGQVATDLAATMTLSSLGLGAAKYAGFAARLQRAASVLAGTGYMGAREGGASYREVYQALRAQGWDHDSANERALMSGIAVGITNALLERLPADAFLFRNPEAIGRLNGALRGLTVEGGTEAAQEVVQIIAEYGTGASDAVLNWEHIKQVLTAMAAGGIVGGGVGAATGGRGLAADVQDAIDRDQEARIAEAIERAQRVQRQRAEARAAKRPRPDQTGSPKPPADTETAPPADSQDQGKTSGRRDPRVIATPRQLGQWYAKTFGDQPNAAAIEAMATMGDAKRYRLVSAPLNLLNPNLTATPGEVDPAKVQAIASLSDQEIADLPPAIAVYSRDGGLMIVDGTHRYLGLQQRGNVPAIRVYVPEDAAKAIEAGTFQPPTDAPPAPPGTDEGAAPPPADQGPPDPSQPVTAEQITEDHGRALGEAAGVEFNGIQQFGDEFNFLAFTDPETGSTFMVGPGDTVQGKLDEMRAKFREADERKREQAKREPDKTDKTQPTPPAGMNEVEFARWYRANVNAEAELAGEIRQAWNAYEGKRTTTPQTPEEAARREREQREQRGQADTDKTDETPPDQPEKSPEHEKQIATFERWAKEHAVPYVSVEESRKAIDRTEGLSTLADFDFVVYRTKEGQPNLLVLMDAAGEQARADMPQWAKLFGKNFAPAIGHVEGSRVWFTDLDGTPVEFEGTQPDEPSPPTQEDQTDEQEAPQQPEAPDEAGPPEQAESEQPADDDAGPSAPVLSDDAEPLVIRWSTLSGTGQEKNAADMNPEQIGDARLIVGGWMKHQGPIRPADWAIIDRAYETIDAWLAENAELIDTGDPNAKLWLYNPEDQPPRLAAQMRAAHKKLIADFKRAASYKRRPIPGTVPRKTRRTVPGPSKPGRAKDTPALLKRLWPAAKPTRNEVIDKMGSQPKVLVDQGGKRVGAFEGSMFWRVTDESAPFGEDGTKALGRDGKLTQPGDDAFFPGVHDLADDYLAKAGEPTATVDLLTLLRHARQAAIMSTDQHTGAVLVLNPDGTLGLATGDPQVGTAELNVQDGYQHLGGIDPARLVSAIEMFYAAGADTAQVWARGIDKMGRGGQTPPLILQAKTEQRQLDALIMPVDLQEPSGATRTVETVRRMGESDQPAPDSPPVEAEQEQAQDQDQGEETPGTPEAEQADELQRAAALYRDEGDTAPLQDWLRANDPAYRELADEYERVELEVGKASEAERVTLDERLADLSRDMEAIEVAKVLEVSPPEGSGPEGFPIAPASGQARPGRRRRGQATTPGRPEPPLRTSDYMGDYTPLTEQPGRFRRTAADVKRKITGAIARARARRDGQADTASDNIYRIISDLARRFNLGPPGVGRNRALGRTALAFYYPRTHAIRLYRGSQLASFVHELGHHLHNVMFKSAQRRTGGLSSKAFPRRWQKELVALGKALYGDRRPNSGYAAEGWAEMTRFLITNPAHLKREAPTVYRDVVRILSTEYPQVWATLLDGRVRLLNALRLNRNDPVDQFVAHDGGPSGFNLMNLWDDVRTRLFDRFQRLVTFKRDLGLDDLPAHVDPHIAALRASGHISGDVKIAVEAGTFDPADPAKRPTGPGLIEILRPVAHNLRLWQNYMVARRTLEKRSQGYAVLPQDPGLPDMTTNSRLVEFIKRVEAVHPEFGDYFRQRGPVDPTWNPNLEENQDKPAPRLEDESTVAAQFQAFNNWLVRDYAVHYGLVSSKAAQLIVDRNLEYITFRHKKTEDALAKRYGLRGGSSGFTGQTSGIRRFTAGKGEQLFPPLEAFMVSMQGIVSRARLNQVARQIITATGSLPGSDRWFQKIQRPAEAIKLTPEHVSQVVREQLGIAVDDSGQIILPPYLQKLGDDELAELIEAVAGMQGSTLWKPGNRTDRDNREVTILVKGKPQFYEVKDRRLYDLLEGLNNPYSAGLLVRVLAIPGRTLRAGATQYNPSFFVPNFMRDTMQALTMTESDMRKLPEQTRLRFEGMRQAFMGGDLYHLFLASGADMAGIFGEYYRPTEARIDFDRMFEAEPHAMALVKGHTPKQMIRDLVRLGAIDRLNRSFELASRMGEFAVAYHQAKARGAGEAHAIAEAGQAAADITLDFQRGGTWSKQVNEVIVFFNAAMLGADKLGRFIKRNPVKALGRIWTFLILPSLVQLLLNLDNEDYWAKPLEQRDRYWYIPMGLTDDKRQTYLKIPKPYGLGAFSIAAERSFARLFGIDPETGERGDPGAFAGIGQALLNELRPTINIAGIQPLLEVSAGEQGYSFYRNQHIVSAADKDLPLGEQGATRSSELARVLGHFMDYPPAKIDYLINGWFGGLGRDAVQVGIDPIIRQVDPNARKGEPLEFEDWLIVRRFIAGHTRSGHEAVTRFYDQLEHLRRINKGLKSREDEPERAAAYERAHGAELALYPEFTRAERRMRDLFRDLRGVYKRRQQMDPDELDQRVSAIYDQIIAEARETHKARRAFEAANGD